MLLVVKYMAQGMINTLVGLHRNNHNYGLYFVICLFLSFAATAKKPEFNIELKDHLFTPSEIEIPANTKVKLIIFNQDDTPEEFDSFDLNREKVIFPHKKAVIFVGPLSPGRYEFFGEFNPNTAKGVVVVKDVFSQTSTLENKGPEKTSQENMKGEIITHVN